MVGFVWKLVTCQLLPFLSRYRWEGVVGRVFNATTEYMKTRGVLNFGLMGFCWGGWALARACGSAIDKADIKCGMCFHPSIDQMAYALGETEADILDAIHTPLLVVPTPQDSSRYYPGAAIEAIMQAKQLAHPSEFWMSSQQHGFMTRGDLSNSAVKEEINVCIARAVDFFNKTIPE